MYNSLLETSLWLKQNTKNFSADEAGSSTVEMVVLMGASITLSLAVMNTVTQGVENLSNDISSFLSDYEIRTSFERPDPGNG